MLSHIKICFNPVHDSFHEGGSLNIKKVDESKRPLKSIRAVLRQFNLDPEDSILYHFGRCTCEMAAGEGQSIEFFENNKTIHALGWVEGERLFIKLKEPTQERQKERSASVPVSTSQGVIRKRFSPSNDHTERARQKQKMGEDLNEEAEPVGGAISKLLGGNGWKSQAIGNLGVISDRSSSFLESLREAVELSLQLSPSTSEAVDGLFNPILVEALVRAFAERQYETGSQMRSPEFSVSDLTRVVQLLRENTEAGGKISESFVGSLDYATVLKPCDRFPLNQLRRLAENLRLAVRRVCLLWRTDQWISQAPLPGLSPVSVSDPTKVRLLFRIASLTQVRDGDPIPDGLPELALQVVVEAIHQHNEELKNKDQHYRSKYQSQYGWSQFKCLSIAVEILERRLGLVDETADGMKTGMERGMVRGLKRKAKATENSEAQEEDLDEKIVLKVESISRLLRGEGWKSQVIGKLGTVRGSGRTLSFFKTLEQAVGLSLQICPPSTQTSDGLFNPVLVEALIRASAEHQYEVESNDFNDGVLERAQELLRENIGAGGKIRDDFVGSVDYSDVLRPCDRFPLDGMGIPTRQQLVVRRICLDWKNDRWISQVPLPGLSSLALNDASKLRPLREMALLTPVREGEPIPNGFPRLVLQVLVEAIEFYRVNKYVGANSPHGWSQTRCLPHALHLLKQRLFLLDESSNVTSFGIKSKASRELKTTKKRKVFREEESESSDSEASSLSELSDLSEDIPEGDPTPILCQENCHQSQNQELLPRLNCLSSASRLSNDDISQIKDVMKVMEGIVERHEMENNGKI